MIYNDFYNIELKINNGDFEAGISNFSFHLHDSIFELYSTCKFTIKDPTGLYRDYLLTSEGNTLSISYGNELYKSNTLKNKYTVVSDEVPTVQTTGLLNGNIIVNSVHEFYNFQKIESKANEDLISNIVSKEIKDYSFNKKTIEKTSGKTIWYKLLMNQGDYITKVLSPNALSGSYEKSPYFAFIDNSNCFNFVPYGYLIKQNPVAELVYKPIEPQGSDINTVFNVKPFRVGSSVTKAFRNRQIYKRSLEDGEYTKEDALIKDYPKTGAKERYPAIIDYSLPTSYKDANWSFTKNGLKESVKSRIAYDFINSLSPEKLIISTLFNPKLIAGKVISLTVSGYDATNDSESLLYTSGNYLIEESNHYWLGSNEKKGITEILVSRKYVEPPKSHSIGEKF